MQCCSKSAAIRGPPAVALTNSGRQPVTPGGHSEDVEFDPCGPPSFLAELETSELVQN